MRGEPFDPARLGHAVAVQERHQVGGHVDQAGVPGRTGTAADRPPHQCRAVRGGHIRDRAWVRGSVVHHQHRVAVPQGGQAAAEQDRAVPDWDQHRDVGARGQLKRPRMGQAGVGQLARQPARGIAAHRAGPQFRQRGAAGAGQPQHANGRAAEHGVLVDLLGARVDDHTEAGGQRRGGGTAARVTGTGRFRVGHSARPPSTGTMAPVIPLLAGLARKASTAATSVGSSSRRMGCWLANAWAPGSS